MTNIINIFSKLSELKPMQFDLFSKNLNMNNTLEFFDLSRSDQEGFLAFINTHSIKTIIDIRETAVFPKYTYQHKFLFQYFEDYKIKYENVDTLIQSIEKSSISLWLMEHGKEFKEHLLKKFNHGSCLVVYDSQMNKNSVELYRKLISSQFGLSEHFSKVM